MNTLPRFGDVQSFPPLSGGQTTLTFPVVPPTRLEDLVGRVAATKFDPLAPPKEERWVLKLCGTECLHQGNLGVITAAVKSGKSSLLAAMAASLVGVPGSDFLGFSGNPATGAAVLHFDTEQSPMDHHRLMKTTLRRAQLEGLPPKFSSYSLLQISPKDRLRAVDCFARQAASEIGGLDAVFIDGVADLALDVNDQNEATFIVDALQKLAVQTCCVLVTALHLNPGSEKSRGHLGSQIERKAESVFHLRKEKGMVTISCKPARREEISGDRAPRFAWDAQSEMHRLCQSDAGAFDQKKREKLFALADAVFHGRQLLRWTDNHIVAQRGPRLVFPS